MYQPLLFGSTSRSGEPSAEPQPGVPEPVQSNSERLIRLLSRQAITSYLNDSIVLDEAQLAVLELYFAVRSLLLAAPPGFGKTELAVLAATHAVDRGERAAFITVNEILELQFETTVMKRINEASSRGLLFNPRRITPAERRARFYERREAILVTTAETFENDLAAGRLELADFARGSIIIDECHVAQGNHAMARLAERLAHSEGNRLVMSGTAATDKDALERTAGMFGCAAWHAERVRTSSGGEESRRSRYRQGIISVELTPKMLRAARDLYCAAHELAPQVREACRESARSSFHCRDVTRVHRDLLRASAESSPRSRARINRRPALEILPTFTLDHQGRVVLHGAPTCDEFERDLSIAAERLRGRTREFAARLVKMTVSRDDSFMLPSTGAWQEFRRDFDRILRAATALRLTTSLGASYGLVLGLNEVLHAHATLTTVGQSSFLEYTGSKLVAARIRGLEGKVPGYLGQVYLREGWMQSALRSIAAGTSYQSLFEWRPPVGTSEDELGCEEAIEAFRTLAGETLRSSSDGAEGRGALGMLLREECDHPRDERVASALLNYLDSARGDQALIVVGEVDYARFLASRLRTLTGLRVEWLAGQSAMSPRRRKEVLQGVRSGILDVVVGTSTLNFGLDLPRVKLLIDLDPQGSGSIQFQKGSRVGRGGEIGQVLRVVTRGCRDELRAIRGRESEWSMRTDLYGEVRPEEPQRSAVPASLERDQAPIIPAPAHALFSGPRYEPAAFGQLFALPSPYAPELPQIRRSWPAVWPRLGSNRTDGVVRTSRQASVIAARFEVGSNAARLLAQRQIVDDQALGEFLYPDIEHRLRHKSPRGLTEAVDALREAIEDARPILILHDYDADGISAAAILGRALRRCGAQLHFDSPCRLDEGFGTNSRIVRAARKLHQPTIVTLDFGTQEERFFRQMRAVATIVLDHHRISGKGPGCTHFVNPHRADCGFEGATLCGAGLAWCAARELLGAELAADLLPYCGIATIADVVPLTGLNRAFTVEGLRRLGTTDHPGLVSLREILGLRDTIWAHDVAFRIGPILNASSRTTRRGADDVRELLLTEDLPRAQGLARELFGRNEHRKAEELRQRRIAEALVHAAEPRSGLAVSHPDFSPGLAGPIASKLSERFNVPTIVLAPHLSPSPDARGQKRYLRGSIRAVEGYDVGAGLVEMAQTIERGGGHTAAGGATVSTGMLHAFADRFDAEAKRQRGARPAHPFVAVDFVISAETLIRDQDRILTELSRLEPYGQNNPRPVFAVQGLQVKNAMKIPPGHLMVTIAHGTTEFPAYLWHALDHPALVRVELGTSGYEPPSERRPLVPQIGELVDLAIEIVPFHDTHAAQGKRRVLFSIRAAQRISERRSLTGAPFWDSATALSQQDPGCGMDNESCS